ncbi:hypothetical protein C8J57DRAFT_1234410 [Mycena rebaudengoi]|nr:hypothetical protein C8J57DRAFT_1234410 [Mycena rebaudengoi]
MEGNRAAENQMEESGYLATMTRSSRTMTLREREDEVTGSIRVMRNSKKVTSLSNPTGGDSYRPLHNDFYLKSGSGIIHHVNESLGSDSFSGSQSKTWICGMRFMQTTNLERQFNIKVAQMRSGYITHELAGEWLRGIEKYCGLRFFSSPNIVQAFAVARCSGLYAMVFNDDLIPLEQIESMCRDPVLTVYLHRLVLQQVARGFSLSRRSAGLALFF